MRLIGKMADDGYIIAMTKAEALRVKQNLQEIDTILTIEPEIGATSSSADRPVLIPISPVSSARSDLAVRRDSPAKTRTEAVENGPLYMRVFNILKETGPLTVTDLVKACVKHGIVTNASKLSVLLSSYKKLFAKGDGKTWRGAMSKRATNSAAKTPATLPGTETRFCVGPCKSTFVTRRKDQRLCPTCSKQFSGSTDRARSAAMESSRREQGAKLLPGKPSSGTDRIAAIREADKRARLKAGGITLPPQFGSDSGIRDASAEDVAALAGRREEP